MRHESTVFDVAELPHDDGVVCGCDQCGEQAVYSEGEQRVCSCGRGVWPVPLCGDCGESFRDCECQCTACHERYADCDCPELGRVP